MQKNDGAARSKNKTNSTKMKTKKAVSVLATCLCMAVTANALAQSSDAGTEFFRSGPGRLHSAGERCRFIDLWSFRVNAADILFTVPNAGLEVDLSRILHQDAAYTVPPIVRMYGERVQIVLPRPGFLARCRLFRIHHPCHQ